MAYLALLYDFPFHSLRGVSADRSQEALSLENNGHVRMMVGSGAQQMARMRERVHEVVCVGVQHEHCNWLTEFWTARVGSARCLCTCVACVMACEHAYPIEEQELLHSPANACKSARPLRWRHDAPPCRPCLWPLVACMCGMYVVCAHSVTYIYPLRAMGNAQKIFIHTSM
eukprot:1142588-Pelagomonas_calceolata.AAC.2